MTFYSERGSWVGRNDPNQFRLTEISPAGKCKRPAARANNTTVK